MKLDLNHLFELYKQIEESELLNEEPQGSASSLPNKSSTKKTKKVAIQRTIDFPRLQMSEDWGESESLDAKELKAVLDAATNPTDDPAKKMADLEAFTNQMQAGALQKNEKTSKLISNLILLETFYRLYNSFDPRALGFINEAFIANLYGASAEDTTKANEKGYIGDITLQDGTPVSIKTKADGKADGSLDNLINSINMSPTGKVVFDIYLKASGDEGVGGIQFYRFFVDKNNIQNFVSTNQIAAKSIRLTKGEDGETVLGSVGREQFSISMSSWKTSMGIKKPIVTLTFSRQKVQQAFNQIVSLIDSNIQELYEKLSIFSKSINEYLSSMEPGRATGPGKVAVETADIIPAKTKEVVK